ncbi:MAG TPA: NTP transferase domain-containing protein, partial [bacterium]|nr:NTP transferase domain-containing protein [bacterium]
ATFPTLPDAPGVAGPLAGILAALRWDPSAAWLMLGCDFPHFGPVALRWLLEHRRPGVWGVLPVLRANSLPVAAIYEPMLLPLLEAQLAAGETSPKAILMGIAKVAQQIVPFELETAFRSFNTPEEWAALVSSDPGSDR